ncbi:MAG: hypothetical protein IJD33_01335, partial [Clostridia bacterium]|nr:hypothetical protein [Clostridia bacterium]
LAALLMFVGCELGMTKEQALGKYELEASVTYFANGGEFSSGATKQEIWYKTDSKPIDLVNDNHTSGTTIKLTRKNHKFLNWYHVLQTGVNDDGTPILEYTYDEKTKQYSCTPDLTRPVDFSQKLEKDEHWYICADWEAKLMVEAYLVSDSPIVSSDDKTYYPITSPEAQENKEAALLSTYKFRNGIADISLDWRPVKTSSDHTFVAFYYDQACTQLVTENIAMGETNVILYAKYMEGDWNIIREASDVKDIFQSKSATDKFYFIQDIDMTGVTCGLRTPRETKCTIIGNGFTVKNLTVEKSGKVNLSLFGAVSKDAVVENLTFENVTCNYTFQKPNVETALSVYFVCASVEEGAKVENVTFKGTLSMNLKLPKENVKLINLENTDGGYKYTNCLFGGDSDAAYTAANPNGFKVEGNPEDFITITK